ncbi:MAG: sigma-70 family RNA polymerase sigma factor [Candidatus Izemoplasmatales bacterium]|jgi:RNA polymerase sigma factor (sigma-70 family)|nr:sigma-70 family RNA polymerase sigma factor [bacterium]MDZ4196675.1 sigma-70 family RNA polymerase sigma factor [Candidatus Izemoplasmatales bacterium]
MRFRDYNDFEILDLIKQGNEEAFQLMVQKYKFLIAKKIGLFRLGYEYEDCFQESIIILYKSIIRFEDRFGKSFTKYFENNLENHLITILRKKNRHTKFLAEKSMFLISESTPSVDAYNGLNQEIETLLLKLSEFEKQVYELRFVRYQTIKETAQFLEIDEKQVHNAIDRIRKKLNKELTS